MELLCVLFYAPTQSPQKSFDTRFVGNTDACKTQGGNECSWGWFANPGLSRAEGDLSVREVFTAKLSH